MYTCTKCRASITQEQANVTFHQAGIGGRCYTYCKRCYAKVQWARTHAATGIKRGYYCSNAEYRAAADERANARYWERVDNYRELGYDPNQQ